MDSFVVNSSAVPVRTKDAPVSLFSLTIVSLNLSIAQLFTPIAFLPLFPEGPKPA